jgi:hypothetical protein
MNKSSIDQRAAIVCHHIAKEKLPILLAVRTAPLEAVDSGWQFLCNSSKEEREEEAAVWTVMEVVELDPSLFAHVNAPIGTTLSRADATSLWKAAAFD